MLIIVFGGKGYPVGAVAQMLVIDWWQGIHGAIGRGEGGVQLVDRLVLQGCKLVGIGKLGKYYAHLFHCWRFSC